MERQEQIKNIKALEADYLSHMETTIREKYLNLLFGKYKQSIEKISECYGNSGLDLSKSIECSNEVMDKYHEKERNFEKLLEHYERSIGECIRLCRFDIKNPVLDCYEKCFITMKEKTQ